MHFISEKRYHLLLSSEENYYRIEKTACDLTEKVRSSILLGVGFIGKHLIEDICNVAHGLSYLMEHHSEQAPFGTPFVRNIDYYRSMIQQKSCNFAADYETFCTDWIPCRTLVVKAIVRREGVL